MRSYDSVFHGKCGSDDMLLSALCPPVPIWGSKLNFLSIQPSVYVISDLDVCFLFMP